MSATTGLTREQIAARTEERRAYVARRRAQNASAMVIAAELGISERSVLRLLPPEAPSPRSNDELAPLAAEAARLIAEERMPQAEACRIVGIDSKQLLRRHPDARLTRAELDELASLYHRTRHLLARIDAGKITYRIA